MKLLFTTLGDILKEPHGRPQEFIKYLSEHHEIHIIATNIRPEKIPNKAHSNITSLPNVKVHYIGNYSPIVQQLNFHKIDKILDEVGSFDIHINYHNLSVGYYISKNALKKLVPTVLELADEISSMIVGMNFSSPISPMIIPIFNLLVSKNIEIAKKITCTTSNLIKYYKIPLEKGIVIPNGVDSSFFINNPLSQVRKQYHLQDEDFIIGFVGTLEKWVHLAPVLQVLKKIGSPFKLLIVGDGRNMIQLQKEIRFYHVEDQVIITGFIPYEKIPQYISCMNVCLIPFDQSHIAQNAVPLKLFEYMACEKPVISKKLQAINTAVGNLVLYYENTEELEYHIHNLYNDALKVKQMGKIGRAFVEKNNSWENSCRRFEQILFATC